ncbi:PQQ-dependent sugar dehydrogenase [Paracoccus sp. p4-l81]|uniref:PQQ-dependent sugar dehydrogenase n=1 Tax=Paracoccus sp. p4-l81 TaxID=3342806 RepID=UPI0035B8117D
MTRPLPLIALIAALAAGLSPNPLIAQENAGANQAVAPDFASDIIARFDFPWALLPLPDGGFLVTERGGRLWRVSAAGDKTEITGLPTVEASGQNGLHDIALAPDGSLRLTAVVPGAARGGDLALFSARLEGERLADLREVWRQTPPGGGGQPGAVMAFDGAGNLFLTVGDLMRPDEMGGDALRGVILRFDADGGVPQVWSRGHRNPYGLVFDDQGRLWSHEMGPRGGDELNLIVEGRDYGWPEVSNGDHYNGRPIPDHPTRPDLAPPALYWTPVIAPAGMIQVGGPVFADWAGDLLVGGLASQALIRVRPDAEGRASEVARYDMGARIRDVAQTVDGAIWVIEDADNGALRRLTR